MTLLKTPHYTIRHISGLEELIEVEHMQIEVWGINNHIEIVPKDILLIVQKNGGLVLGAFDPSNKMVGFLFGFIGQYSRLKFKHCSHMMGVLPEYRHHGVGENLKYIQRKLIQEQGLDLITWTVNPLEGVNASLNFGKLGVVCKTLLPNFYGEMEDELNKGLPSDRFEVEWWINSKRVAERIEEDKPTLSVDFFLESGALRVNHIESDGSTTISTENWNDRTILLEVPASFQEIKLGSLEIALSWILQTRLCFQTAFAAGYIVSEFFSELNDGVRHNFYVLQKNSPHFTN